jgi:hypothetical protein
MGFFNRDYRCFENDSIDTAAMFERAFDFGHDTAGSLMTCSFDDSWSADTSDDDWLAAPAEPWYGDDNQ